MPVSAADTDFTWSAGSDAYAGIDHYELWIDSARNRDAPVDACSGGTCSAKAAATLAEGSHTWQVRAVDKVGNTGQSEDAHDQRRKRAGRLVHDQPEPGACGSLSHLRRVRLE